MIKDHGGADRNLPVGIAKKIEDFRSRVRRLKMTEAALWAGLALLSSFLVVFALDRIDDFPNWVRAIATVAAVLTLGVYFPIQFYRWVTKTKSIGYTARILGQKDDAAGDRILSAIELTGDAREYNRSPELTAAAIRQVDEDLANRDFTSALPDTKNRRLRRALALPAVACVAAFIACPEAAMSSLVRWAAPLGSHPRWTFAKTEAIPDTMYVAKGERFTVALHLASDTRWRPETAVAKFRSGATIEAYLENDGYLFDVPACHRDDDVEIAVGDAEISVAVRPLDRPAVTALDLGVRLPDYLGITKETIRDGRSGGISTVEKSRVSATAHMTRALAKASVNGKELPVTADGFTMDGVALDHAAELVFSWTDTYGLEAMQPFTLALRTHPDAAPTVRLDGLKNGAVILSTDTANFKVVASDDFGVRKVGIAWQGIADELDNREPAKGEKILRSAEEPDAAAFDAECAFNAPLFGIKPQELDLRPFAEDALPGRERVYGAPIHVYVLTPEQHMMWLTAQLNQWRDEAIEVRDRESELWETNKALRKLSADELNRPKNRKKLESQAAAEKANGRRLKGLVGSGKELLDQATRNTEFNSNTLDDWAETMKLLENIAQNRMPSVSDLLAKAARASGDTKSTPGVTEQKGDQPTNPGGASEVSKLPNAPTVSDIESTMMQPSGGEGSKAKSSPPPSSLRMPSTLLAGGPQPPPQDQADAPPPETPSQEELDKALAEQKKLLEEFAKVAGQIKEVLANLEGSTFVKRFKAESREHTKIAKSLHDVIRDGFGILAEKPTAKEKTLIPEPARRAEKSSASVGQIQDDLSAFVTRLEGDERQKKFKTVLDEMKKFGATTEIRALKDDVVAKLNGDAACGAEFWADTTDRWAEMLVGPG